MDQDFWHQRWRDGQIGFHQAQPTPLLQKHWSAVGALPGAQVFVPLAGKSLDMLWLVSQGHRVLAVELSQLAVDQFFSEHGLTPEITPGRYGVHHRAGDIDIIVGDVFALDADALAGCAAVYDRAALIALPPELRERYVSELYPQLPSGCRGLLITLEYPQREKEGPPFSVTETDVMEGYRPHWNIDLLERSDILSTEPRFIAEGVTALDTCVYRLRRRD